MTNLQKVKSSPADIKQLKIKVKLFYQKVIKHTIVAQGLSITVPPPGESACPWKSQ